MTVENGPRGVAESDDREAGRAALPPETDALFSRYLGENLKSGRFPFTPQGIADCVDNALGRAVFETIYGVLPGDPRAAGAGQTGESLSIDCEVERFHDEGGPVPPDGDA